MRNFTRTRIHNKFEYHKEDIDCYSCLYYIRKTKANKNGCQKKLCRFDGIKQEAIANGRIKRPPGWFKFWLPCD